MRMFIRSFVVLGLLATPAFAGDAKKPAPAPTAPAKDAPKADAPKADAPVADAPTTEAPKAEAPKTAPKKGTKAPAPVAKPTEKTTK